MNTEENNHKKESEKAKSKPEELMNEGLGNKEKFQSETFREVEGEIKKEEIETIENAEEKKS